MQAAIGRILLVPIVLGLISSCTAKRYDRKENISGIYGNCSSVFKRDTSGKFLKGYANCFSAYSANLVERINLHSRNEEILKSKYQEELHYKDRQGVSPEVGLALSGGGPRSASFSIGILKALSEKGIMDKVDVISSVSGGSYASYWYFIQNCYLNKNDNKEYCPLSSELKINDSDMQDDKKWKRARLTNYSTQRTAFKTGDLFGIKQRKLDDPIDYRFQVNLEESSDILSYSKKPGFGKKFREYGGLVFDAATHFLSIPFHWIFNGLFDWDVNFNPYRKFYQNGLERTYGYVPLSYNLDKYANDESSFILPKVSATEVKFSNMSSYLSAKDNKKRPMPYFIINATGGYDRAYNEFGDDEHRQMHKAIFEFTPWRCGSDLFGYFPIEKCDKDISFSRAVSISGAAVDGQQEQIDLAGNGNGSSKTIEEMLNILNWDLGYRLANPNTNDVYKPFRVIAPFPLYHFYNGLNDDLVGIHLSDGGHSENLGVFSLVRRGTKRIIAIDAEEDKQSEFQGAQRLKVQLEKELGLMLVFDEIDKPIDVYNTPVKQAVISGKIHGLVDEHGYDSPIELLYIKLSLDRQMLQERGQAPRLRSYSECLDWCQTLNEKGCPDRCQTLQDQGKILAAKYPFSVTKYQETDKAFPHDSTMDLFYSPEQYRAYRDLGYTIINVNNKKIEGMIK